VSGEATPVAVGGISTGAALAVGDKHACACLPTIRSSAGAATSAISSVAASEATAVPVAVSGISGATSVSAGSDHACALVSGGAVWCWGQNEFGGLGNGSLTDSSIPGQVKSTSGTGFLSGVFQVSSGGMHSCALVLNDAGHPAGGGKVYCWATTTPGSSETATRPTARFPRRSRELAVRERSTT